MPSVGVVGETHVRRNKCTDWEKQRVKKESTAIVFHKIRPSVVGLGISFVHWMDGPTNTQRAPLVQCLPLRSRVGMYRITLYGSSLLYCLHFDGCWKKQDERRFAKNLLCLQGNDNR